MFKEKKRKTKKEVDSFDDGRDWIFRRKARGPVGLATKP
jgi:hypothetical protein